MTFISNSCLPFKSIYASAIKFSEKLFSPNFQWSNTFLGYYIFGQVICIIFTFGPVNDDFSFLVMLLYIIFLHFLVMLTENLNF